MNGQACREYRSVARGVHADLFNENTVLVKRIAHHLAARLPSSVDVDDLVQAGLIGLMDAARNYDPAQGASFETFASIRIRGAMLDEIRRNDWMPRSVHRGMRQAAAATHRIEQSKGRPATAAEVASMLDMPLSDYQRLLENAARGQIFSLDEQIENVGEPRLAANADPAEKPLEQEEFRRELAEAIAALPEREKLLMSLYYEQELNMREIAAVFGVTESRVCQLHGQAVVRLRARLAHWQPQDLLE